MLQIFIVCIDKSHQHLQKDLSSYLQNTAKIKLCSHVQCDAAWSWLSVIRYLVQFSFFIPCVPLAHPDYPLNREFGKIGSLKESHQDPAENGKRAPRIRSHNLFGSEKSFFSYRYTVDPCSFIRRKYLPFYFVVCKDPAIERQQNKAEWISLVQVCGHCISPRLTTNSSTNHWLSAFKVNYNHAHKVLSHRWN